jgi:hypothetical protein
LKNQEFAPQRRKERKEEKSAQGVFRTRLLESIAGCTLPYYLNRILTED